VSVQKRRELPKLPPSTLSFLFCPSCGRMDLRGVLGAIHNDAEGKNCPSDLGVATYRLDSTTLPSHSDRDVGSDGGAA
jgi:hypothetical protein